MKGNVTETQKTFAEFVRNSRLKSGLTNKEFAKKCSVSDVAIWRYETFKEVPSLNIADRILKSLGLSMMIGEKKGNKDDKTD